MSIVVGLGETGCAVANEFKKYSPYTVYNISVGSKRTYGKNFYIKKQSSPEEYEEKCPSLKNFFKNVKGEVLFIVDGSELVSAASLCILSYIKHCSIRILYIRSEPKFRSKEEKLNERAVCGILQEYARSAVFDGLIFVDVPLIGTTLSDLTVKTYHPRIRDALVSTLHMIEVFSRSTATLGGQKNAHPAARLTTVGYMDIKTGKENMFFPLDYLREKCYYYAINEKKLETDPELLGQINEQTANAVQDGIDISYGVYSTEYEKDYVYVVSRSSAIQR